MYRRLRQGDPLYLFLYILVMKGLYLSLKDVVYKNLLDGARVGDYGICISHFFYADDVVIASDWNHRDMDNII